MFHVVFSPFVLPFVISKAYIIFGIHCEAKKTPRQLIKDAKQKWRMREMHQSTHSSVYQPGLQIKTAGTSQSTGNCQHTESVFINHGNGGKLIVGTGAKRNSVVDADMLITLA